MLYSGYLNASAADANRPWSRAPKGQALPRLYLTYRASQLVECTFQCLTDKLVGLAQMDAHHVAVADASADHETIAADQAQESRDDLGTHAGHVVVD